MQYTVKMTSFAIGQVQDIISYISHELQSPETALRWADLLQKEISELGTFPSRFPCVETEPWKSKGIRKTAVKNFIIYYLINEDSKTVWITAVIYGKRNQIEQLRNMPY